MRIKTKKIMIPFLTLALSVVFTSTSFADSQENEKIYEKVSNNPAFKIISPNNSGSFSFTNAPDVDQQTYNQAIQEIEALRMREMIKEQNTISPQASIEYTYYRSAEGTDPLKKLKASHHDTVKYYAGDLITNDLVVWSGNSYSFLNSDTRANTINQSDEFSVTGQKGSGLGFSWPASGSVNFEPGNNSAQIVWDELTDGKQYDYQNYYSGVRAEFYNISYSTHSTTARYRVGNTGYLSTATSNVDFPG
ncbi:hypothetical protein [Paenibacillus sp. FSL R5-0519]|uniref:hypothetical protein n=1 Tax=Paenibacillus sp. FSL R5-0519 TaxID=2921648 RepID=UPI0030DD6794